MIEDSAAQRPSPAVGVADFVPQTWPDEVTKELEKWTQGCLVPATLLGWCGPRGDDPVTGQNSDELWDIVEVSDPSGWSIVVSQTCDIGTGGPGAKHPFVLCSPLVEVTEHPALNEIQSWKVTYLLPVTKAPNTQSVWAADLRAILPVSKAALATILPIQGLATASDQRRFSIAVGEKFRRPAFHESLSTELKTILDKALKTQDCLKERIEQVRLECRPDLLNPKWVRVHVVCKKSLGPNDQQPLLDVRKSVKECLKNEDITFAGFSFDDLDTLKASDYRQWEKLALTALPLPEWP